MDVISGIIQIVKWALLVVFLGLVIAAVVAFRGGIDAITNGMLGLMGASDPPRWGAFAAFELIPAVGGWHLQTALVGFTTFLVTFAVAVTGWRLLDHFIKS